MVSSLMVDPSRDNVPEPTVCTVVTSGHHLEFSPTQLKTEMLMFISNCKLQLEHVHYTQAATIAQHTFTYAWGILDLVDS